jgi:hypothetical protein
MIPRNLSPAHCLRALLVGAVAALLTACAGAETPVAAAVKAESQARPQSAGKVSPGKARAPVRVVFDRKQGFEPGDAGQIQVTLSPQQAVEGLTATFRGSEGLVIGSGASFARSGAIAAGTALTHPLVISAQAPGRYKVTVMISTSVAGRPIARAVAIPVIVGDPALVQEKVRAHSAARIDSTGERIKSMPGELRTR